MTDQTPATEAGRRLLVDIERVVWAPIPGSRDVWAADILAIEAEARADALREAAERVRALDYIDPQSGGYLVERAAVLRILDSETTP